MAQDGPPRFEEGKATYDQGPEEFADDLAAAATIAGCGAAGGCCGTEPRFIAALATALARRGLR